MTQERLESFNCHCREPKRIADVEAQLRRLRDEHQTVLDNYLATQQSHERLEKALRRILSSDWRNSSIARIAREALEPLDGPHTQFDLEDDRGN
jgi:hypothetical protein